MDFKMFRWPWKKKSPVDGRAVRVAFLVEQIAAARAFQKLVHIAMFVRLPVTLMVEANGCEVGVLLESNDPMLEYLINFAAGAKLGYQAELEELEKQAQQDADRADCGDLPKGRDWDHYKGDSGN